MLAVASFSLGFQAPMVAPAASVCRMTSPVMSVESMEGAAHETGFKVWDPCGLADLGSPATLAWYRHAELKHGRVCMAAFVGWLVAVGVAPHFPGDVSFSEGVTFDALSKMSPLEQWAALPGLGKAQILAAIGIIEHQSEWKTKPHYMAGGTPGSYKALKSFWDPIGLTSKMDAKKLERQRLSELKNGRLAMIGITSVLLAPNMVENALPVPINFPAGPSFVVPF